MNNPNKIDELENRISSLESLVDNLIKGEFDQLVVNKLIIKEDNKDNYYREGDFNKTGIFIYDRDNTLLYETVITEKSGTRTEFYDNDNNAIIEFGLCEHGAGRLVLNNINGEKLIYLGTLNAENNHSARFTLSSQDQTGYIEMNTSNLENDGDYLTDLLVGQNDDNDEDNMIYLGVNNSGSIENRPQIRMESNKNDQRTSWSKTSSDKF
jgi:hypothetical protein